jgi:N-acetylneuraminate lyase
VFITGSRGECNPLPCAERLLLYAAWADAGAAQGVAVIAHVGGNSLEEARILARRARSLALSAVSSIAPSYFKPATVSDLVDWCAAIAAEVPDLPFYFYDIPSLTGVSLSMERFLVEAGPRIPNLTGIKCTNPDLVSYRRCLDVGGGRFDLPWGVDEALLGALATGARGGVGSTYNWSPRLYADLLAAFGRGDLAEARRLQSISIGMVDAVTSTSYMGTSKALIVRLGVPVGPARPPLVNPSPTEVDALMARLNELGFEEWGAAAVNV